MTLIILAEGLPEILPAFGTRLGSTVVLPLAPREGRPALRVLVRARKGGRAPFRLLAPFVIHQGTTHDGDRESYTPAANAVLRDGADLLALFS
jgi:tRNA1Val (adenine37-N6)-methyltransferase